MKMKIKNIIIAFSFSLAILSSCSDEIDYNEIITYDKGDIFSSFDRTKNFVTNIYAYMDYDFGNYYSGAMLASACDEAEYAWTWSSIHDFYNGSWSSVNPKQSIWVDSYAGIRSANLYLIESKGQPFEPFKPHTDYPVPMDRFPRSP